MKLLLLLPLSLFAQCHIPDSLFPPMDVDKYVYTTLYPIENNQTVSLEIKGDREIKAETSIINCKAFVRFRVDK